MSESMPPPHVQRRALKEVTDHALNSKEKSKPGPKPKPLHRRKAAEPGHFMPPVKRDYRSRTREFKLGVLCYWKYGLVPDEDQPEQRRHVTWQEVCKRYRVKRSTIYG